MLAAYDAISETAAQLQVALPGRLSGASQDDPELVPLSRCRYDFALEVTDDTPVPKLLLSGYREKGRWAVTRVTGDMEVVDRTWNMLFKSWLPQSGVELRDAPAEEIYHATPEAIGWDSAPVLDYSFGGMVAQELALRHPDRVEGLVLMSTSAGGAGGSSYPRHELAELPGEQRVRRLLELADRRRTPQWQAAHATLWQSLIDDGLASLHLNADDPAMLGSTQRQLSARHGHDTWERLPGLRVPVCVCAGRYDAIATPEVQRRLAGRIPGAVFRDFEGGHLFFLQDPAATPVILDALAKSRRWRYGDEG